MLKMFCTVLLGIYFTALQACEYVEAAFTIAVSAYGSALVLLFLFVLAVLLYQGVFYLKYSETLLRKF
jgi:heme/copper-type cytochrome/quinol oxidase subunit 3